MSASPEPTNADRAERAESVILTYMAITGTDLEDALGDLLCDLMHWADAEDFWFDAAMERSRGHYQAECADEPKTAETSAVTHRLTHCALDLKSRSDQAEAVITLRNGELHGVLSCKRYQVRFVAVPVESQTGGAS